MMSSENLTQDKFNDILTENEYFNIKGNQNNQDNIT